MKTFGTTTFKILMTFFFFEGITPVVDLKTNAEFHIAASTASKCSVTYLSIKYQRPLMKPSPLASSKPSSYRVEPLDVTFGIQS